MDIVKIARIKRLRRFGLVAVGGLLSVALLAAGCSSGASTTDNPQQTVDTVPPTVSISSPTAGGTFSTSTATLDISGSASDNVGVSGVNWANDRGGSGTASGTTEWTIEAIPLQPGDNEITITASDAARNQSSDTLMVTYTPSELNPPTITITSPTSETTFVIAADTISVGGTASDDTGIDTISWVNDRGGQGVASGTTNWLINSIALQQGANVITVTARDIAGNTSADEITITRNTGSTGILLGIGIIGDSDSDEYRADDNRGGAYASVTFNWMEQLVLERGLNFGAWGTRAEPRRSGYEFNWARSGATTGSMIDQGQHTGVAQQVASGDVTFVIIRIGVNDFTRSKYDEIYNGSMSGTRLTNKINRVISDITTAVDTVLAAGQVEILLTDLYDYSVEEPQFVAAYPDAQRRQVVTDAIRSVNAGLATMAQDRGIVLVEVTPVAAATFARVDTNGFLNVGGELIDTRNAGDEPHHMRLGDAVQHPGTIANSLYANDVIIAGINNAYGQLITPFTEQEMLEIAGIAP